VNIARISTPINTGNARLSPQQLLQMQQRAVAAAQQQQTQAMSQAQAQHAQAQVQVQSQTQGQGQAMNIVSSANVKVAPNNGPHISPVFANRDASSSPAHLSPPHTSVAAGGNVHNSPRLTAGQMPNQTNVLQQAAQMAGSVPRPPSNLSGPFYLPNTMPGAFTQEQLQNALRLQMMVSPDI
jgi:chromatin modification-related protein VID21